MKIKRQDIANAGMLTLAKVNKDVQRGRLDEESLVSIASYIVMARMGAGGLTAVTGVSPEPALHEMDNCPQPRMTATEVLEKQIGMGMRPVGFTPSYDDGQDQG